MPPLSFPLDYNAIRKALVDEVQKVSGLTCVLLEPETQNVPRPPKPYFGMKFLVPGAKFGDDSAQSLPDANGNPTTVWNYGGQRKMTVSFQTFGNSHEEAYNYMAQWQSALELETVQADLRLARIAVWLNGDVADLSALLNTGFEGRAQMDVQFGISANMTADLGEMDSVTVEGVISTDQKNVPFSASFPDGE